MKINWNFLGGGGWVQNKKPFVGGVWTFLWNCTIEIFIASHLWQTSYIFYLHFLQGINQLHEDGPK